MNEIPNGYLKDSRGRLVPEENVKTIDKLRHGLVKDLCEKAQELSDALAAFKGMALAEINGFVEVSAAEYGVDLGGKKGNVTLTSYCGRYRVQKAIGEHIIFDERLQIAKELIDQCINRWGEDSNEELRSLATDAFRTNGEGRVSVSRIMDLRRHKSKDPKWKTAMDAIADSMQVNSTTTYVRFYVRIGETDQYEQIPLDIAGVKIRENTDVKA